MNNLLTYIQERLQISRKSLDKRAEQLLLSWEDFLDALRHQFGRVFINNLYPDGQGPMFTDKFNKNKHEAEYIEYYCDPGKENERVKVRCFGGFIGYFDNAYDFISLLGSDKYEDGIEYYNKICRKISDKV